MIGAKDITCYCGYIGRGVTMDERLVDKELHERTHKGLDPTDPDAAQAKDEKEMAMYVIIRTDNQERPYYVNNILCHSFESAKQGAAKLAQNHVYENPCFEIYELVYCHAVEASIDLRVT